MEDRLAAALAAACILGSSSLAANAQPRKGAEPPHHHLAGSARDAAHAPKPQRRIAPGHGPAAERLTRTITVGVNGEPLAGGLSAQIEGGRVVVPLRETFAALGLAIEGSGGALRSRLPTGDVTFSLGSTQAFVDGRSIALGAAVAKLQGTIYVPLSLLVAAFGAQATYDQRSAHVEIVSSFFGRTSDAEQRRAGGGSDVEGVVSAVDSDSVPPSITVVRGGGARAISVSSNAKIWVEDVTIHNQVPGKLADVAVGDALHAILARDGRLVSVFDYYRSMSGTISATSSTALVLADGRVVTPSSATRITLDAAPARLSDLATGDYVTVRSNPESGELREIVASRRAAGIATTAVGGAPEPGLPGSVTIASVALSAQRPLREGQSFDVLMKGTPHGRASFDIGDYLANLPMREAIAGVYVGRFAIPARFNVTDVPVYAMLTVRGITAPRTAAPQTLSAATIAPTIDQVAPLPGQTVNNPRPSIFATYAAPTSIGIDVDSVALFVDGHDVTLSATRMGGFVVYSPAVDLHDGRVSVVVKVSDAAGNTATKTWDFTVRR